jgi:hypothetical protein
VAGLAKSLRILAMEGLLDFGLGSLALISRMILNKKAVHLHLRRVQIDRDWFKSPTE